MRWLKPAVFALSLLPLVWLGWQAAFGSLGVNPVETLNRTLGDWALRFLLLALAVTPVRQWTHWAPLARLRRMMGLFAFFYVCLHLASYVGVDLFFDWAALWKDVVKRTYITLGMGCFVLLLPLALTSTDGMIRRLGGVSRRHSGRRPFLADGQGGHPRAGGLRPCFGGSAGLAHADFRAGAATGIIGACVDPSPLSPSCPCLPARLSPRRSSSVA